MDERVMAAMESAAQENAKPRSRDRWTVKGELICGDCGELKVALLDSEAIRRRYGEARLFPVACLCRRREADEVYRREREAAEAARREKAMPSERWRASRFEADDGRDEMVRRALEAYADRFGEMSRGEIGIMLTGGNGTGKTFWAAALANRLLDEGRSVMMATMVALTAGIGDRSAERENLLAQIGKVDLLVIDDMGAERESSYGLEKIFEVLDARYNAKKPVVLTTNLCREDLEAPADMQHARIYSRAIEMCPMMIALHGERRGEIAGEKRESAKEIIRRRG